VVEVEVLEVLEVLLLEVKQETGDLVLFIHNFQQSEDHQLVGLLEVVVVLLTQVHREQEVLEVEEQDHLPVIMELQTQEEEPEELQEHQVEDKVVQVLS